MEHKRGRGSTKRPQGGRKPLLWILGIAGAVAVVAIGVVLAYQLGRSRQPDPRAVVPASGGRGTIVAPENVEDVRKQLSQPVEDGYYRSRMNTDWVFPASGKPSTNAYVENTLSNKRTVYFDLTLADTNQLIYSSPYLPVGAKLEKFALSEQVPAGEYKGIVTYHLVDDDNKELSTVSVSVSIRIEG